MLTAVAIAQLADAGKLSYDDKLSQYVDASWYPKNVLDKVTIRQLLSHRAGFGDMLSQQITQRPTSDCCFCESSQITNHYCKATR
jgi:CubicO group peptidase (beta-lactamase class C family)